MVYDKTIAYPDDGLPARPAGPGVARACTPSTRWPPRRRCSATPPRPTSCSSVRRTRPVRCASRRRRSRRRSRSTASRSRRTSRRSAGAASRSPTRPRSPPPSSPSTSASSRQPSGRACPRRHHVHREVGELVARRAANLVEFQDESVARRYVDALQSSVDRRAGRAASAPSSARRSRGAVQAHRVQGRVRGGAAAHRPAVPLVRAIRGPGRREADLQAAPAGAARRWAARRRSGSAREVHVALRMLAKGKRLRGTKLDPFGYAHVRRVERELLDQYAASSTAAGRRAGRRPTTTGRSRSPGCRTWCAATRTSSSPTSRPTTPGCASSESRRPAKASGTVVSDQ